MKLVEPVSQNKWGPALLAGAACAALFTAIAVAAVVAPDSPGIDAGYLVVPVSLTVAADDDVSGVLFDLTFDPEVYELVDVFGGDASDQAGKDVQFAAQGVGAVRVLVTGFNQNTIASGTVASVYLKPLGAKQTDRVFSIENSLLSDPLGQPVADGLEEPDATEPASVDEGEPAATTTTVDDADALSPGTTEKTDAASTGDLGLSTFMASGGVAPAGPSNRPTTPGRDMTPLEQRASPLRMPTMERPAPTPEGRAGDGESTPRNGTTMHDTSDAVPARTHLALHIATASAPGLRESPNGALWFAEDTPPSERGFAAMSIALAAGLAAFIAILTVRGFLFGRLPSRRHTR